MDFSAPRKSRLSGPQPQAWLSRLADLSRLSRLKDSPPRARGSSSPELRTCATPRSPTNGFTTWTRARGVSCRKDSATDSWWEAASAGAAAPSWTHSWNTQKPAATPKPREGTTRTLTSGARHETGRSWHYHGTQEAHCFARRADVLTTAAVPGRAVRPWTCVSPPPMQRQLAEMLHRRRSIVNCRIADMKSENRGNRVFSSVRCCGPRTGGRIPPSLERSSTR